MYCFWQTVDCSKYPGINLNFPDMFCLADTMCFGDPPRHFELGANIFQNWDNAHVISSSWTNRKM